MQHAQAQSQDGYGQSQSQKVSRFWRPAAIGGVLLALTGFYEPIKDLYLKFYNPDYRGLRSVRFAARQLELADRNAACFLEMQRSKVQINPDLAISYGACPNRNVHIGVYPKNQAAYQRWLEPNLDAEARLAGLFPQAFAGFSGVLPARSGETPLALPAQMALKTVCQNWHNAQRTKIDRITDEGGQCYFERVNVLSGVVEVRETVPCNSQCEAISKTFN
jgi:hypothetical protein